MGSVESGAGGSGSGARKARGTGDRPSPSDSSAMNSAAPLVQFRPSTRPTQALGGDVATDHDLIRGIQVGEAESFRALFERHERRAYGIAYQMVGNAEEAADVVQEAFLRVHRSIDRFDFSKAFTTWLYRIVVNLAIDGLRRERLRRDVEIGEFEESIPAGSSPEAPLEADETVRLVRGVLDALPPKFKAVMVLRDLHGLSGKEISSVVGATHATVRWRLHRARTAFRALWERSRARRGQGVEE